MRNWRRALNDAGAGKLFEDYTSLSRSTFNDTSVAEVVGQWFESVEPAERSRKPTPDDLLEQSPRDGPIENQTPRTVKKTSHPKTNPAVDSRFDAMIAALVDGDEGKRASILSAIRSLNAADGAALGARLRNDIQGRFSPNSATEFGVREIGRISSTRSWMLSCLVWADPEHVDSRTLILRHLQPTVEPDRSARFWTLANLYQHKISYLSEATFLSREDDAEEMVALANAIDKPDDPQLLADFKGRLFADDFYPVWQVLRLLRVIALPTLASDVCALLGRTVSNRSLTYDALYALTIPAMARAAAPVLDQQPGIAPLVRLVLEEVRLSNPNAARNFCVLLDACDALKIDHGLDLAHTDVAVGNAARDVSRFLAEFRARQKGTALFRPGYRSDAIDITRDYLDIRDDVNTLTTVMLARDAEPPLAIGLFGEWGSGKTHFMEAMEAAAHSLAAGARDKTDSKLCTHIVQIRFNAWHYVDTNLWASLVSHILDRLAVHVNPQRSPEEQQTALLAELSSAKSLAQQAEAERMRAEEALGERGKELQQIQQQRLAQEVVLSDLRLADLQSVLASDTELRNQLSESLQKIGAPVATKCAADLSSAVADAYTTTGRVTSFLFALLEKRNRWLFLGLLALPPILAWAVHTLMPDQFLANISGIVMQFVAVAGGAVAFLRRVTATVKSNFQKVETAKQRVDSLLQSKRAQASREETTLQADIDALKAKEKQAAARLSAAATLVIELEARLVSLKEARSLTRFLVERNLSDDYRKHLGLISTIRNDFEMLTGRLISGVDGSHRVERIILYIDDLDRCPTDKVMEVLQAVYLLLAYPLFVVVVGVDPRWLLHSLSTAHPPFQKDGDDLGLDPDLWRTTPQNYLEKIFQIPFCLRPMTPDGFGRLLDGLFNPVETTVVAAGADVVSTFPPAAESSTSPPSAFRPDSASAVPSRGDTSVPPKALPGTNAPTAQSLRNSRPSPAVHEESLTLRPWEARFAEKLFPFIPTPRAAKRFANIYRLLKASVSLDRLAAFEGSPELEGEFRVPMLLLAILIGSATDGVKMFPNLRTYAREHDQVRDALLQPTTLGLGPDSVVAFTTKLKPIFAGDAFPFASDLFNEWIPRVARFSFEIGRAMQAPQCGWAENDHQLAVLKSSS